MELHVCPNCELVNQIVENKLQTFDILTQENISLHKSLIKAREEIVTLQSQITDLNKVIFAEREQNLQQYIKAQDNQYDSNVLMNFVISENSNELHKHFTSIKDISKLHECDSSMKSKCNSLTSLFKEQREMYEENLTLLQTVNFNYVKQLEEQLQKAQDHASVILSVYSIYRKQFFIQKKENCKDHKKFLKSADMLTKANNKYVLELEQNLIEMTRKSVNEEAKGILNSLLRQIEKRDKLVSMLRQQQTKLTLQIEQIQKEYDQLQHNYNENNRKLREQLKREKEKYSSLEQRRAFDFEGFSTDIKQCKKEVLKMKQEVSGKTKLIEKMDHLLKVLVNKNCV
ncbi:hypothetical protein RI129_011820 [Pyrocoelia pectoralis]|uniref:Uncharacterized protein n=1 Tax=Pyrocoelia pectoralis TaxID=417401 RepID=A0AAN7V2K1_9COLE